MEETAWVIDVLKLYGLAGVVMLALSLTVRALWKRNNDLNDTITRLVEKGTEAQSNSTAAINRLGDMLLRGKAE